MNTKKQKGFRIIEVENKRFWWKFSGGVDIRPEGNLSNKLMVNFGWYDVWACVNDNNKPEDYEPKIITPKFIRQAIIFGLMNDWDISSKHKVVNIGYRNRTFVIE